MLSAKRKADDLGEQTRVKVTKTMTTPSHLMRRMNTKMPMNDLSYLQSSFNVLNVFGLTFMTTNIAEHALSEVAIWVRKLNFRDTVIGYIRVHVVYPDFGRKITRQ